MKIAIYALLILLTVANIFFASFPLLKGEMHFFNDVARDFLLLSEINEKKIMLIGPRSNVSGLFHGPLWSYVNFPVYKASNGNPIASGWFWILVEIAALTGGFVLAKKLFGTVPALIFIYLYSYSFIDHINGIFHSDTPIYLTPFLFFAIVFYVKSKKFRFLFLHLFIATMIMQLNVGVGIPILILSVIISLFLVFRNRQWKHLTAFLFIPIFLMNFIVFDLRHEFLLSKSAFEFYNFQKYWKPLPLPFLLRNRLESTVHLQFYYSENFYLSLFIFAATILTSIREIMLKKLRMEYLLMLYFYLGYMLLSFTNKGVILSHFIYLMIGLTSLWFASLVRKKYQLLFFPILLLLIFLNFRHEINNIKTLNSTYFGKDFQSWRSLSQVAETIISRQGKNPFRYYVFAPDAFAYGPRYAMIYNFNKAKAHAFEYEKKAITYVVAEPAPKNDPYMTYVWWR